VLPTPPSQRLHAYTSAVWAPSLSLATTREILSFPEGTKMFQFPSCPAYAYVFCIRYPGIPLGGFPHSDTSGSSLADSSPKLFAVYHVLHRPLAPRHPPCALTILIICASAALRFAFCSVVKVPTPAGPWPAGLCSLPLGPQANYPSRLLPSAFCLAVLMEMRGFEPLTSSVQGRRSPI
jgi:hypothetical protein